MAKFDMYEAVTKRILDELNKGNIPWLKPWTGAAGAWSRATGKPYSLLNQLMLPRGEYVTKTELFAAGGDFIYDENGKRPPAKYVWSFWWTARKVGEKTNADTGEVEDIIKPIPHSKYYKVYNVATDTTLDVKHHKDAVKVGGAEALEELEAIKNDYISRERVGFTEERGDRAYYSPAWDKVVVPCREQFSKTSEFYSTVFHELAHSTGAQKRLKRFSPMDTDAAFGSESYSREELVAELTACSILANMGIETRTSFRNSAAYIQSWANHIKNDPQAIIKASAKAEKAYALIMNITEEDEEQEAEA